MVEGEEVVGAGGGRGGGDKVESLRQSGGWEKGRLGADGEGAFEPPELTDGPRGK